MSENPIEVDIVTINDGCNFYCPKMGKPKPTKRKNPKSNAAIQIKPETTKELFSRFSPLFSSETDFSAVLSKSSSEELMRERAAQLNSIEMRIQEAVTNHLDKLFTGASKYPKNIPLVKSDNLRIPVHLIRTVLSGTEHPTLEKLRQYCSEEADSVVVSLDGNAVDGIEGVTQAILDSGVELFPQKLESVPEDVLQYIRCKTVFELQGKLVPPLTKKDSTSSIPSSIVFVVENPESATPNFLADLVAYLYNSGVVAVVILIYRVSIINQKLLQDFAYMLTFEDVTIATGETEILDTAVYDMFRNFPIMLGPKVMFFIMEELAGCNRSWSQISHALTVCWICHYGKTFPLSNTPGKLTSEQLDHLRKFHSFRRFLENQQPDVQIEMLLDNDYLNNFFQRTVRRFEVYRENVTLLIELIAILLRKVATVPWWKVYDYIHSEQSWRQFPDLQELTLADEGIEFTESCAKCQTLLRAKSNPDLCVSGFEKAFEAFKVRQEKAQSQDPLLNWKQRNQSGSLLAFLLDCLCKVVHPLITSLVFTEHFVFDEVFLLSARLRGDIKSNVEKVLADPAILLQSSKEFRDVKTEPDLSLVRRSIRGQRRNLSFPKSISMFVENLKLETGKEDITISPEIRARFMSNLPALHALGILSLAEKGRKCFYTVV